MRLVRTENRAAAMTLSSNPCLASLVISLEDAIRGAVAEFTLKKPNATNRLRNQIETSLTDFKSKVLILPNIPITGHDANYRVDFIKTIREHECGNKHQIAIELCFDNRQVIGTNILKAHLANNLMEKGQAVSILLVAEEKLRDQAYDSSIGTESEYETALLSAYSSVVDSEIILFTLLS